MSAHSLFSPSKSAQWINCPGSMAFPANQVDGGSSTFADNGTASHHFSALTLANGDDASDYIHESIEINGVRYEMDEERAEYCQVYIDDVRRRAIGGSLFVEYHVDLSEYLGEGQGGTADALIYLPSTKHLIVEDLKYGTGERVYAEKNPQLLLYALGALQDVRMMGYEVEKVTVVICQPRLSHIDEYTCDVAELEDFARKAALAVEHAGKAMLLDTEGEEIEAYINPGEKQCRWCRNVTCKKRARLLTEAVMADFDEIEQAVVIPSDNDRLSKMFAIAPFVEQWIKAVRAETFRRVAEGAEVLGSDGKPLKFVQGKEGKREWDKEKAVEVEALLVGQLGPKAYKPHEIITAPAAGKLLDKAKTKETWALFQDYIKRGAGQPVLALGSDTRPPFSGAAAAGDFDELGVE